jgi:hypothetical protein
VSDTKNIVADHWNFIVDLITLLYLAKQPKDGMIFSSLRIPLHGHIIVYIREMRSVYLRSCQNIGPAGNAGVVKPPAGFQDSVGRLATESGHEEILWMKCFKFHGYGFHQALAELGMSWSHAAWKTIIAGSNDRKPEQRQCCDCCRIQEIAGGAQTDLKKSPDG